MFAGGAAPGAGGAAAGPAYPAIYTQLAQRARGGANSRDYMRVIEALQGTMPGFRSVVRTGGRDVTLDQIRSDIQNFQNAGGAAAVAMQALSNII